jgi:hypothetical protein
MWHLHYQHQQLYLQKKYQITCQIEIFIRLDFQKYLQTSQIRANNKLLCTLEIAERTK